MQKQLEKSAPIVAGPLKSSRFGRTVVVDLGAPQTKMVVERGSVLPRASLIVTTCARDLQALSKDGTKLDAIVVVGTDCDPVDHPDLRECTDNLRALRDKWFPRAKLLVITETRDLASYDVRAVLGMYDRVHLQFEWGTAKTFSSVTGAKGKLLGSLVRGAGLLDHVVVEAAFFRGAAENSSENEIKSWIKKLLDVKPQEIHILDGTGSAAEVAKVRPVTPKQRERIAETVAESTGFQVSLHEDEELLASA